MPAQGPMACPLDGTTLVMSERQGIEIDYCPSCRGVWLDRGELDKIIERNSAAERPAAAPANPSYGAPPQPSYGHGYQARPHKRRKSFLEELFD
jgi:Zn-finger nucleic acid-binding protein